MNEYEREIELYDYIEVLLKYKWFILAATLVCGGFGWVFRPAPPQPLYEADVVLMIKRLPSQNVAGGTQADVSSVGQTSGFYQALALADDLKQALIDSLNLKNMSLTSMDGLLQVQVLDPGVRLSVRSHDRGLPIDLVNTWAKFFVERNGDLNVEEVGSYYDYVKSQYDTARPRLDSTEARLHVFEAKNAIGFQQLQRATLDSTAIRLYREMVDTDFQLRRIELDHQLAQDRVASADSALKALKKGGARGLDLQTLQVAQAKIDSEFKRTLNNYDNTHQVNSINRYLNNSLVDSLQIQIGYFEKEIKNHTPELGGTPNPTYINLMEQLSQMRLQHETAKAYEENAFRGADLASDSMDLNEAYAILQHRKDIIQWFQEAKENVRGELTRDITQRDSIAYQRGIIRRQQQSRKAQLDSTQLDLNDINDTLATKMRYQQRLLRDQGIFSETVARFSKLFEEARIIREKAAGVGFLLSSILSLFAEYMRKARQNRVAGVSE
jgi:hypothetical protein